MDPLQQLFQQTGDRPIDLDALMRIAGRELHHYARALAGSSERADDALQDALVTLSQQGSRLKSVHNPRAWLFTVLRRKALQYHSRKSAPMSDHIVASVETDHSAGIVLREALATLDEAEQEVILLHCWEGLTFDEIGHILNSPHGTVLSRYHRAINKLRERLDVVRGASQLASPEITIA